MSVTPGMREFGGLGDRIKTLESKISKLELQRRLQSASIGSGGLTVRDSGVIKSGDFVAGSTGWQIEGDGSAEFQGSVIIGGTLTVDGATTLGADLTVNSGSNIQSSNFVSGSAGWQASGDGSAEFNDVVIRGDIESGNWDGASPADLSSRDTGATAGFYLDSSAGAAQFEGDIFLGGSLNLSGVGTVTSDATGSSHAEFAASSSTHGVFFKDSVGSTQGQLTYQFSGAGDIGTLAMPGAFFSITADIFQQGSFQANDGSAGSPTFTFDNDTDTGVFRVSADRIGWAVGGIGLMSLGSSEGFRSGAIDDATTGTAANVNIESTGNQLRRSTSALKYKTDLSDANYLADIELTPMKFYREDDDRYFYGFIADWLGGQDELLGVYQNDEIEDFDTRAVLAVLAAKINRLEAAWT